MSMSADGDPGSASWQELVSEAAVAVVAAALFTLSCLTIDVPPLERVGQVSGLASLGLRFTVASILLIVTLLIVSRRRPAAFPTASRLACAALAGLASGIVAGGIVVALQGTSFGLNGMVSDTSALVTWSRDLDSIPPSYPPLPVYALSWFSRLFDVEGEFAVKHLQIIGTALLGPAAYLSWRLLLRPSWALAIGVVAALPLVEAAPYKPYGNGVLIVLVPLAIRFIAELRDANTRPPLHVARTGVWLGAIFGVLCLTYSGWFQWSAPGVLIAMLLVFPWRRPGNAIVLLAMTGAVFFAIAGRYLLFAFGGDAIADKYIYFDVLTEPAYIAMYRGDLPGQLAMWPPFGELAGVGVYTLLLAIGLGIAVALGRSRSVVVGAGCMMAGAWLVRFWYAHALADTHLVQLYPRTTAEILYCLLAIAGFAIYLVADRYRKQAPDSRIYSNAGLVGAVCALALILGSAGSAIANAYMPLENFPYSPGRLAWAAHHPELFEWTRKN